MSIGIAKQFAVEVNALDCHVTASVDHLPAQQGCGVAFKDRKSGNQIGFAATPGEARYIIGTIKRQIKAA